MNEQTRKRLETARAAREDGQSSPTTAKIRPTDTTAAGITSAAPSSVAPPPTPAPKRNRATDPTPNELAARQRQRDRKSSINPTPSEAAHRERLRDRYSTRHRQRAFLHAIIQTFGNASAAAKMADVKIENHYRWRRSSERYRRALKAALKRAAQQRLEAAESKLYRKAVLGWNERTTTTVHGKDGVTTTIKERNMEDTTALIFLLKALDPGKYRERTETQLTGSLTHNHLIVVEDPNWYGNNAHNLATHANSLTPAGPPTSIAGDTFASEVQGGCVWPSLGQDRAGPAGDDSRPRPDPIEPPRSD